MSDIYSSVTSAIGTHKGPMHGGANMAVMQLLEEIEDPGKAEKVVIGKLEQGIKIPGSRYMRTSICILHPSTTPWG